MSSRWEATGTVKRVVVVDFDGKLASAACDTSVPGHKEVLAAALALLFADDMVRFYPAKGGIGWTRVVQEGEKVVLRKGVAEVFDYCGHSDHTYDPDLERYACCDSRVCRCPCR